jgi:pilus assembly protein Flp/PilA
MLLTPLRKISLDKIKRDERGVTAIEYGLIAGLVSMACIVALMSIGGTVSSMYSTLSGHVADGATAAAQTTP